MKKRNIVRIITVSAVIVLIVGAIPVSAANYLFNEAAYIQASEPETVTQVEGEVTEWCYRNNNGIFEKRLWSVTYGKWLTEWMPA